MQFAILRYQDEAVAAARPAVETAASTGRRMGLEARLEALGRLKAAARLLPTTTATTIRATREPPVMLDGPAGEGALQLASLMVVECATLTEAVEVATEMARTEPGAVCEVRPLAAAMRGRAASLDGAA